MKETIKALLAASGHSIEIEIDTGRIHVSNESMLRSQGIDALVYLAVFAEPLRRAGARWLIWETAQALGIHPSSIHELYVGRGHDRLPHPFTTPALNIRAMSYDTARAAFCAAVKGEVGAFLFELSRSEMTDTDQRPAEYSAVILAAAIKEGFRGPVFLQGDHFQVDAAKYLGNTDAEVKGLCHLVDESVKAGFYNIEFDTSTLVDLSKPTLAEQQHLNCELTALLSDYVRSHQPHGVTISLGGEIGEGGKGNSNVREVRVFMDHYQHMIQHHPGLSKLSIQAGTARGGLVLPDGAIAPMNVDFALLEELARVMRREYGMGGAVLHGASTLPDESFGKLVQAGAIEAHLATGFQNILFEHLPEDLYRTIRSWLFTHVVDERKPGDTEEQFVYKTRRKATGSFKKEFWNLPEDTRSGIRTALQASFTQLFNWLGVERTADVVSNVIRTPAIHKRPEDYADMPVMARTVREKAD